MAVQEFFIDSDGVPVHAKLEMPEGEPERCPLVIVQHGLTGNMDRPNIVAVAEAIREAGMATLRTELYGHGKSGGTFERHTIFKWIDEMLDVIDYAKGLDFASDLYLCGHSQGGFLTMAMGAARPDDLKALVLLAPGANIPRWSREGRFLHMTFDPEHVPDRVYLGDPFDASAEPEGGDRPSAYLGGDYFRLAQRLNTDEIIDAYPGPVLLVQGTNDALVPYQDTIEVAERYADSRLLILEGDTHSFDRHRDRELAAVREFLEEMS